MDFHPKVVSQAISKWFTHKATAAHCLLSRLTLSSGIEKNLSGFQFNLCFSALTTWPRLLDSTTNSELGLASAYMHTKDQIVGVGQGMEEEQIK